MEVWGTMQAARRRVMMAGSAGRDEFNYTPKEHYWSKSSFTFFGRRRDIMRGPSSTAAHAAAHRGPPISWITLLR